MELKNDSLVLLQTFMAVVINRPDPGSSHHGRRKASKALRQRADDLATLNDSPKFSWIILRSDIFQTICRLAVTRLGWTELDRDPGPTW